MVRRVTRTGIDFGVQTHVDCAHEGCSAQALMKIQTSKGWVRLCEQHYDAHFVAEGLKSLATWGVPRLEGDSKDARLRAWRL